MPSNRTPQPPRQFHPALVALIDILLIAACLCAFALFDHVLPHSGQKAVYTAPSVAASATPAPAGSPETAAQPGPIDVQAAAPTPVVGDFSEKFAGIFTDGEVIQTDTSYRSANLNITLTETTAYYGSYREVYFVEDIYILSIECLRTVFAKDTFGKAISEDVVSMSKRTNAIAAINSDYCGYGNAGIVIRNGVLYRREFEPGEEVLIIYRDGDMKIGRAHV